jgi:hypothetical protein
LAAASPFLKILIDTFLGLSYKIWRVTHDDNLRRIRVWGTSALLISEKEPEIEKRVEWWSEIRGLVMHQTKSSEKRKTREKLLAGWQQRSKSERRSKTDSRSASGDEYLSIGGKERREKKERRQPGERRDTWMRVDKWRSVSVFDE